MKSKILQTCLIGVLLLLSGCAQQAEPVGEVVHEPTQIVPTPMNSPDEVAALMQFGSADSVEQPEGEPASEPTEVPMEEPQANYCVECHTDKDMLIDTARPEEEVISENEGAG